MFVPRNVSHSLDDGHEFYKQQLVVETHMLTEITQNAIGIPYVLNGLFTSIDHTPPGIFSSTYLLWDISTTYSPNGK